MFRNLLLSCSLAALLAVPMAPASAQTPLLPARGDASASIVILLFSDFQCPYCAKVDPVLKEIRDQFPKDVQILFKHNPLPIHPQAPLAHEAAVEAGRQGKFWEMHDLLFASPTALQPEHLTGYARTLGLDMNAFTAALEARTHRAAVERDMAEARALGVTGTPAIFVNGRRAMGVPAATPLVNLIKSLLSGGDGSEPAPVPTSSFDLSGAPSKGPADAPVTIVLFSDFQCGFCFRANATVTQVLERYRDKVRLVFKHYPLDFHADAPLAHRAALAAHQQGKFWEMHDRIFANQRAMKRDDLLAHAVALGLDVAAFTKAMDGDGFTAVMARDLAEGSKAGVDGTPTFFINGMPVVGARPLDAFTAVIDRALAGGTPAAGAGGDVYGAVARGPADAPVTIRWFADLTSGLHRDALAVLREVVEAHPGDVRLVFRHAPLAARPEARLLHEAAVAGAEQGRFWELHDVLLQRPIADRERLAGFAAKLGLDRAQFLDALQSGRAAAAVDRDLAEARALDVRGTPTFFVNDARIDGVASRATLDQAIATALAQARAR